MNGSGSSLLNGISGRRDNQGHENYPLKRKEDWSIAYVMMDGSMI